MEEDWGNIVQTLCLLDNILDLGGSPKTVWWNDQSQQQSSISLVKSQRCDDTWKSDTNQATREEWGTQFNSAGRAVEVFAQTTNCVSGVRKNKLCERLVCLHVHHPPPVTNINCTQTDVHLHHARRWAPAEQAQLQFQPSTAVCPRQRDCLDTVFRCLPFVRLVSSRPFFSPLHALISRRLNNWQVQDTQKAPWPQREETRQQNHQGLFCISNSKNSSKLSAN